NDSLNGNGGNDSLEGGAGNDALSGGGDQDNFVFREYGAANADTVADFASNWDMLRFDASAFTALGGAGHFAAGDARFYAAAGATGGHAAAERLVYNASTGQLYYDPRGAHALARHAPVDRGDAAHGGEVDVAPVLDRHAEHRALVPAVVGDELERMPGELAIVGVAIVGELDRRHHRAHEGRDAAARIGRIGGRQVGRHFHGELELDDQMDIVRGAHARGRAVQGRGEHDAGLGSIDADEALHLAGR